MRSGVVASFDEHVGLGTIRDDEGREWSFHCTRITDGSRSVVPGTRVVFEVGPGAPGRWEATSVLKLTAS
jgi:cold shock CspA family protein